MDIILQCHYYQTKEQLLRLAAAALNLTFQNHPYQLYADLAQSTIIKRRALRPYLQILQEQEIRKRWGYPFKLIFHYEGRQFQTFTPHSTKMCYLDIGLPLPSLETPVRDKSQSAANGFYASHTPATSSPQLARLATKALRRFQDQKFLLFIT